MVPMEPGIDYSRNRWFQLQPLSLPAETSGIIKQRQAIPAVPWSEIPAPRIHEHINGGFTEFWDNLLCSHSNWNKTGTRLEHKNIWKVKLSRQRIGSWRPPTSHFCISKDFKIRTHQLTGNIRKDHLQGLRWLITPSYRWGNWGTEIAQEMIEQWPISRYIKHLAWDTHNVSVPSWES